MIVHFVNVLNSKGIKLPEALHHFAHFSLAGVRPNSCRSLCCLCYIRDCEAVDIVLLLLSPYDQLIECVFQPWTLPLLFSQGCLEGEN